MNWPDAELDNVRRLRVLASGVSGAVVSERVLPAAFDAVWSRVSDFEGAFGDFEPDMRGVRLSKVDGERLELLARSRFGFRARLHAVHRPGWFWAQSRFLLVAVAAAPEPGGGTRVAVTGGVRVPGRAALVPVGVQRAGRRSLDRLAGMVG
ncbi:hypothetical protein [Phytomonospora endophytica]|uniref:SRPBCC family protein n=1 Tax=Phytomonospora endophytica TaxID=714109 RepID=A0A841FSK0_9ACTN|nr:hypothetical protein [Phytomonospora endophytica]MBB6036287.1 hypothetical protein [Phytomonospora endophytica]GIG67194.1 hypothetical protein Pen01_34890 [Phytomonospora endophytica]